MTTCHHDTTTTTISIPLYNQRIPSDSHLPLTARILFSTKNKVNAISTDSDRSSSPPLSFHFPSRRQSPTNSANCLEQQSAKGFHGGRRLCEGRGGTNNEILSDQLKLIRAANSHADFERLIKLFLRRLPPIRGDPRQHWPPHSDDIGHNYDRNLGRPPLSNPFLRPVNNTAAGSVEDDEERCERSYDFDAQLLAIIQSSNALTTDGRERGKCCGGIWSQEEYRDIRRLLFTSTSSSDSRQQHLAVTRCRRLGIKFTTDNNNKTCHRPVRHEFTASAGENQQENKHHYGGQQVSRRRGKGEDVGSCATDNNNDVVIRRTAPPVAKHSNEGFQWRVKFLLKRNYPEAPVAASAAFVAVGNRTRHHVVDVRAASTAATANVTEEEEESKSGNCAVKSDKMFQATSGCCDIVSQLGRLQVAKG